MVCMEEVADLEDWGEVGVEHDGAKGGVLADAELEEEGGEVDDGEHEEVGDQEGATPVLETQVGEPPDVPEADSVAEAGEKEVQLPRPVPPLR